MSTRAVISNVLLMRRTMVEVPNVGDRLPEGFIMLSSSRSHLRRASGAVKPSIYMSKDSFFIDKDIYHELGSPDRVAVGVEPKQGLLYLAKQSLDSPSATGYSVSPRYYNDGEARYRVRKSRTNNLLMSMPLGYYVSIGGGVYKYHGIHQPLK